MKKKLFFELCSVLYSLPRSTFAWNNQQCLGNWSIVNGQIYTPGLAIVDSPQPCTPEGGDYLQVALDVSGDGHLPWPPVFATNNSNVATGFYNITIFLYSYEQNTNFTITNNTNATGGPPISNILYQESGSTVKHVNWLWPDCLVGNGANNGSAGNARGDYNISIHQSYRLNGSNYYTIFDLPIPVTNSINEQPQAQPGNTDNIGPFGPNGTRISCQLLENPLWNYTNMTNTTSSPSVQPYIGGPVSIAGANQGSGSGSGSSGSNGSGGNGNGEIGSGNEPGLNDASGLERPHLSVLGAVIGLMAAVLYL